MRNNTGRAKKTAAVRLLDILIIVALVFLAVAGVWAAAQIRDAFARDKYNFVVYDAEGGNFGQMCNELHERHYDVAPFETEGEEAYHVAEYADTLFRLKYCEAAGETDTAAMLAERMETARAGAGSLRTLCDELDEIASRLPYRAEK